jgi:hypothetical protein
MIIFIIYVIIIKIIIISINIKIKFIIIKTCIKRSLKLKRFIDRRIRKSNKRRLNEPSGFNLTNKRIIDQLLIILF